MYFFHDSRFASAAFSVFLAAIFAGLALATDFRPPAGERCVIASRAGTILPGGRILRPLGTQLDTGPGPRGLAVSHNGSIATADTGPERFGVTVIEPPSKGSWRERHIFARTPGGKAPEMADPTWRRVTSGIVFDGSGKAVWVSEGESGRVREIDQNSGDTRKTINLNGPEWHSSVTGELAADNPRHLLFVADRANSRIAVIDLKAGRVESSVRIEHEPSHLALYPDAARVYVTTADSVCTVDVRDPVKPGPAECVPADSPRGIVAAADRIFVSNGHNDSILVFSPLPFRAVAEIPLRIPSLEQFRGLNPAGMAFDPVTKWLLVAESGINAVGVVDTETNMLMGHLPVGWMPTRVALSGDRVYVTNALGRGTGPNLRRPLLELGEVPTLSHGSVSTFIMPGASELIEHTGVVFANDGFVPWMADPPKPPSAIRHVVLIVKEGRTFDEVLGDIAAAGNSRVLSFARLARFGMHGLAIGGKDQFSVQDAQVTPNHHAIATTWAFSDDFYADGFADAETLSHHLEANKVKFQVFDDKGLVSDQTRADRFIAALAEPLPQFVYIRLRNDQLPEARTTNHPYEASWMEDNDLALGRILDSLSHSPWWPETAVFVTESNTDGGLDHIDSHRTILLAAGPYVKRNYVSHTNSNFPGLLRTVFELLHIPPVDLADATAASLSGMFTDQPGFSPFQAIAPDVRIFDPGK
jgi:DNA-binding beta-propeller fold protein YncE